MEQDLKAERPAQDLGEARRDQRRHHGAAEEDHQRPREMPAHVHRQRGAGDDPQAGRDVLQKDQHQRAQRDDPEQRIAELAAAGQIGGPVARVDETDRDDEPRAEVAKQLAREQVGQKPVFQTVPLRLSLCGRTVPRQRTT